jgi:hypothetical protein
MIFNRGIDTMKITALSNHARRVHNMEKGESYLFNQNSTWKQPFFQRLINVEKQRWFNVEISTLFQLPYPTKNQR